jgi:hypothetical protein
MTGFLGTVGMIQAFHKMATAGQIEVGALIRRNLYRYDNYRWTCCGISMWIQSIVDKNQMEANAVDFFRF